MLLFFSIFLHCVNYFYLFTNTGYCSKDEDEGDECDEDMSTTWDDNTIFEMFQKWFKSPFGKHFPTSSQATCQTSSGSGAILQSQGFKVSSLFDKASMQKCCLTEFKKIKKLALSKVTAIPFGFFIAFLIVISRWRLKHSFQNC